MSSDNYYLVRPATRKEKRAVGVSGPGWTAEMRFASVEYVPGERGRASCVFSEQQDAISYAANEFSEYGCAVETDVPGGQRLIAPVRVWVRDTRYRVGYWWRYRANKPSSRWSRVKTQFNRELIRFREERALRRLRHMLIKTGWSFEEAGKAMSYSARAIARLGKALATTPEEK